MMSIKLNTRRPLTFIFLLLILVGLVAGSEEQIKWTPNEENAPLPLSMKQRQQLLQLEEAIRSSPDPAATLEQAAKGNGMSPQELANMLEKNAQDLQQSPSLAQPTTIPKMLMKVLASFGVLVSQSAKKHPQSFTVTAATLLLLLYATIMIPRTGMHVSSSRKLCLSRGPTCMFAPNQKYLQKLASAPWLEKRALSVKTKKTKWDDLTLEEDGIQVHKLPRKSELVQAVSAQLSLSTDSFFEELSTGNEEDEDLSVQREEALELLFENAASLLSTRQLTEFSSEKCPLQVASSSDRQKHGIIVVPGLGDFGRYGLMYWQVTRQMESDKDSSLTITTLKGMGFVDGQIHFEVKKYRSKISVSVHLVVPKGGRKIPKGIATKIVNELAQSLATSASRRTEQTLARQSQGRRFKSASHSRATERRHSRFEKEKLIETMAEDRRRKWQRGNPDAGRYRPSGDRQRSPNNC
jgi:hypothetical protein